MKDVYDEVYFLIVESALDPRFRKRPFNDTCTLHEIEQTAEFIKNFHFPMDIFFRCLDAQFDG